MEKKHSNKNHMIQRIKQINKANNLDFAEFLVKYYPKNTQKENNRPLIYIEREINIPKKLSKEKMTDDEKLKLSKNMKDKFEKEMKLISKFSHPNIMKIIDYFENPEYTFHIISENYQCDLAEFIRNQYNKKKYFSESLILSIFTQICLGIKYIHDLNILHRNINPSNILLITNKMVKLSNFDLYRILYTENERSITLINNTYNEYISPEMSLKIPYSFKNDIWALGILLFHMMALKTPFNLKQLNEIQSMKKVDPIFLSNKIPKHFSNDIKNLCIDLLKAYPAERPDINSILTKYRIIKNEVKEIQKMFGNNFLIQNNINVNKTVLNNKIEDKNKISKINYKARFQSLYANKIKIDNNIKNKKVNSKEKAKTKEINNNNNNNNECLRLSVYENIKDKIKDPNNIMEQNYITGEIINIPDNGESIDFNNLKFNGNSKETSKENNNNIHNNNGNKNNDNNIKGNNNIGYKKEIINSK